MPRIGYRKLLTNAGANSASTMASLAVSFVLAPIVLHAIGDARYGAWSFVESFVAYLTLFDFGIAAAIVRFTSRNWARENTEELNRTYSASMVVFLAAAVIAIVIGAVFEILFLQRFLHSPEFGGEIRWLFRLLVFNFAMALPMSIYSAMLDGLGRFGFKSIVRLCILGLRVPLILLAIRGENRLVALGCVITACTLAENIVLAFGVWRAVPALRFRPRHVDRATLRQMGSYSRDAFTAMIAGRLAFQTDAFVIAPILGPVAITLFSIPSRLVEMGKSLLRSATTTLTSAFSALEAVDDHDGIRATFLSCSRAAWYTALPLQFGLLILGYPFLMIWVGPHYARSCSPVLLTLAIPLALSIAQSVAARLLYGTGQLRQFARMTLTEGISNILLSIALVVPFGVLGVAVGTAIPHIGFCLWVIHRVCCYLDISARQYLAVIVKPLIATLVASVTWSILGSRGIDSWATMFVIGAAGLAIYAVAVTILESVNVLKMIKTRSDKSLPSPTVLRAAG